jgi:hypothetical protein
VSRAILTFLAVTCALSSPSKFHDQTQNTQAVTPHLPRGTATDVSNVEIQTTVQKMPSEPAVDRAIRVVSINGEYNVGISVLRRAKTGGTSAPEGIEHSQITEVYHVIEGHGTLVTGASWSLRKKCQRTMKQLQF